MAEYDVDFEDDGDRATMPFNLTAYAVEVERSLQHGAPPAPPAPSERESGVVRVKTAVSVITPMPDLSHVPHLLVADVDLAWFECDEKASKVLMHVDGTTRVQAIVARAELAPAETLRVIGELALVGILGLR